MSPASSWRRADVLSSSFMPRERTISTAAVAVGAHPVSFVAQSRAPTALIAQTLEPGGGLLKPLQWSWRTTAGVDEEQSRCVDAERLGSRVLVLA